MITNFYMPTGIVAGPYSLGMIGILKRELKMPRVLVVSNPAISSQSFHAADIAVLQAAGLITARFDECGIDVRCSHIGGEGEPIRRGGIHGVVCICGGSVMCAGKSIAIVATNRKPMAECIGAGMIDQKALPTIMVSITAGSGFDVS